MSRVLLVTPPWLPFHTLQVLFPNVPPQNLQVIGGVLKNAGHEVYIADIQHLPPLHNKLFEIIDDFKPDIIGISNNETPNAPTILKIARTLRQKYPDIKLLAGGQVPTFKPEIFLKGEDAPFDAVALYEAESTVVGIVEALMSGASFDGLPGVAFSNREGKIVRSQPERNVCDLNASPLPYWKGTLKKASFSSGLSASVETARGCPFSCTFCSVPGFYGRHARYKSVERIMTELRELKRLGVTEVYFIDDSFATRPKLTYKLFESMIKEKMNMRFLVQIRADIIVANPDLIKLGAQAGMYIAIVGFEGYFSNVQADANKGNSGDVNRKASMILRQNRVVVYGTHIFGSPESSIRDNLITFTAGRRNSDIFRMTIFTPLLGSQLYNELVKKNTLASLDWSDFYEGKYLIKGGHNPLFVEVGYFGLLLLHYVAPDTLFKLIAYPNRIIRTYHHRAYKGAFRFVLGQLKNSNLFSNLIIHKKKLFGKEN